MLIDHSSKLFWTEETSTFILNSQPVNLHKLATFFQFPDIVDSFIAFRSYGKSFLSGSAANIPTYHLQSIYTVHI